MWAPVGLLSPNKKKVYMIPSLEYPRKCREFVPNYFWILLLKRDPTLKGRKRQFAAPLSGIYCASFDSSFMGQGELGSKIEGVDSINFGKGIN